MTQFRLHLVALALLCIGVVAQARDAAAISKELVALARFDAVFLLPVQMQAQQAAEAGKIPKRESDCLNSKSPAPLTEPVAAFLAARLSAQELDAALHFYASDVGKKFTQYGVVAAYKKLGHQTKEELPAFSNAELAVIRDFSNTAAGNKLMRQQVLIQALREVSLQRLVDKIHDDCRER